MPGIPGPLKILFKRRAILSDEDLELLEFPQTINRGQSGSSVSVDDTPLSETDSSSTSSFSTNATMDDIPGTGRTIDTYLYQPLGRKIERFAMRYNTYKVPPLQILAFFKLQPVVYHSFYWYDGDRLSDVMEDIAVHKSHGSTMTAGLKSLVRQSR